MTGRGAAGAHEHASGAPGRDRRPDQRLDPEHAGPSDPLRALARAAGNRATHRLLAGRPLPPSVRTRMESGFGVDLAGVRVHHDDAAARSAEALAAKAYTVGSDIVFSEGRWAPGTEVGSRLLAHELAHVVQQARGGPVPTLDPAGSLEAGARGAADAVLAGAGPVQVAGAASPGVAREAEDEPRRIGTDLNAPPTGPSFADPAIAEAVEAVAASRPDLDRPVPTTPPRDISYEAARAEADRAAARVRRDQDITDPNVQAGHTRAARHVPESGASDELANDPDTFMHLHSRRSYRGPVRDPWGRRPGPPVDMGLDVQTVLPDGTVKINTRHRAQERLIDDAVERARAGGRTPEQQAAAGEQPRLTPEGQAAVGDEVLWRTQGTGFDQREVQEKRASGTFDEHAAIESLARKPGSAIAAYRARKAAGSTSPGSAPPASAGSAPTEQPAAPATGTQTADEVSAPPAVRVRVDPSVGDHEGAGAVESPPVRPGEVRVAEQPSVWTRVDASDDQAEPEYEFDAEPTGQPKRRAAQVRPEHSTATAPRSRSEAGSPRSSPGPPETAPVVKPPTSAEQVAPVVKPPVPEEHVPASVKPPAPEEHVAPPVKPPAPEEHAKPPAPGEHVDTVGAKTSPGQPGVHSLVKANALLGGALDSKTRYQRLVAEGVDPKEAALRAGGRSALTLGANLKLGPAAHLVNAYNSYEKAVESGQDPDQATRTAFHTTVGAVAAARVSPSVAGLVVEGLNTGAQLVGAPEPVQLATSGAAELVPSQIVGRTVTAGSQAFEALGQAFLKNDPKAVDRLVTQWKQGGAGPWLQGYTQIVDITVDTLSGARSFGQAVEKAAKEGKYDAEGHETWASKTGGGMADAFYHLGENDKALRGDYTPMVQGVAQLSRLGAELARGNDLKQAFVATSKASRGGPMEQAVSSVKREVAQVKAKTEAAATQVTTQLAAKAGEVATELTKEAAALAEKPAAAYHAVADRLSKAFRL